MSLQHLGGIKTDSESADDMVFKEYRELGPKRTSLEQYLVAAIHLIAALLISVTQFNDGIIAWFLGFGLVVPILLIIQGFAYSVVTNDSWYREQMIPFMLSIVMTTEIETDRYLQFRRRLIRFTLILGWPLILMCQMAWNFGLTRIMPVFDPNDLMTRFIGELVGYAVIFGPFLAYGLGLILIYVVLEKSLKSRYEDIKHLLDIENKWFRESHRRAKNPESVKREYS